MKIAHVSSTFPPYEAGTGRVCYFNALELAKLGHQVTVFTAQAGPVTAADESLMGVRRIPTWFRLGNAPFTPGLVTALQGFDLIHLHFPYIFGSEFVWLAARLGNIPYLITHHNDLIMPGKRQKLFNLYYPLNQQLVVRGAQKFAVVSQDHAENCQLTPIFAGRWQDVCEIPNGVETDLFYPSSDGAQVREQYQIAANATVITFVAALDKAHLFKGLDRLIRAFAQLHTPDTVLLIIGDGDMRDCYQRLTRAAQVAEQTIFVGKIAHHALRPYYAASDIVVLPSDPPESFGMVLAEASACGCAVIASNIPGVRSVVEHERTGLLFEQGSLPDLVAALTALLQSPDLRRQLGENGVRRVKERYSWRAIGKKLEVLYQQVLSETGSVVS